MTESQIYERLTAIFRDVLADDQLVLAPTTTARDVPGWDSFNHVVIIVAVEMAFGVKFHTAELERMQQVSELVALIARKQARS